MITTEKMYKKDLGIKKDNTYDIVIAEFAPKGLATKSLIMRINIKDNTIVGYIVMKPMKDDPMQMVFIAHTDFSDALKAYNTK